MTNVIKIGKPTKRIYGNEYPVSFVKSGRVVHKIVVFGNDLKWVDRAYTREFVGAPKKRMYLKKKKK
jgi:hypothetical protein